MKNQNIVMLCQQSWDIGIGTSARNLAKEFAKHNRVLYINMPLDVNTVLTGYRQAGMEKRLRVLLGLEEGLVLAEPNVWVLTPQVLGLSFNWLPMRNVFNFLNRLNSRLLAHSIGQAIEAVGFDSFYLLQDGIIFQGLELKRLLAPRLSIYYLRDYMLGVPYFRRHGPWVEARLLEQADVVVTNSVYLGDYARGHNPNSFYIGQGCALGLYQADADYPMPADLAEVAGPIIVYTGYLTSIRLDMELLLTIARLRPQWNVVLVGPEDEAFRRSALHELSNVHFLGNKAPEQLAPYIRHSDVCINPQVVNEATVGNYPLKIDEYLAMGKPVVATATRAMDMFADYVYLARNADEWLEQLDAALADQSPDRSAARIAFAQGHSWEASVRALDHALATLQAPDTSPVAQVLPT
ncbi:hypothetical protein GCM10027511_08750 [Hymenobacter humi]